MNLFNNYFFEILMTSLTLMITILMIFFTFMQRNSKYHINAMRDSFEKQIYVLNDRLTATIDRWTDVNHLIISSQAVQPAIDTKRKVPYSSFLKANGIAPEEIETDPNLIMVLTPFNKRFDAVFNVISKTCQNVGLKCKRGDEEFIKGEILQHVLKLICMSNIVIVNIEGRNPNVFYELGLAHAMDKTTILISSTIEDFPIDIRTKNIIVYKNINELENMLKSELLKIAFQNKI